MGNIGNVINLLYNNAPQGFGIIFVDEDIWRIPEPLRPALAVPGDGLSRITRELLEKVQQHLADTMIISSGPDLVRQAFTDVLAAAVKRAAPLLAEVGKLPFETEAERLAFAKFVCSNGRIERASSLAQMFIPSLLSWMIDDGVGDGAGGGSAGIVVALAIAMAVLAVAACALSMVAARIAAAITTKFSADLRQELYNSQFA